MRRFTLLSAICAGCFLIAACGGSSTSSDDSESGSGGSVTLNTTAASVFPIDLVVTSPYASSAASASISASKAITDFETEKEELQEILGGTEASACNFSLSIFDTAMASPSCYGPTVDYANHPNGVGTPSGQLPQGDLGIWSENEGSEVCSVAKINQLIDSAAVLVDSAVNIFASVACTLNVNEVELPAVGTSLDLASEFQSILTENAISGITITSVSLARSSDDAEGHAVYDFAFVGSLAEGSDSRDVELFLRHIPLNDDNSLYKGKISYNFSFVDEQQGNQADAGSVLYHKSSETQMNYRMQYANFVPNPGVSVDPLDESTRDIDPTLIQSTDSASGWANNFNYSVFSINPSDGTGDYAYAWSAGSGDPNTRVFNASVAADASGTKSGCAYYGYGPQASLNQDLGSIDGMICNWAGPGNNHTVAELVQRQCVIEDSSGAFVADSSYDSNILYSPTNDCNYPGGTFSYESTAGGMNNDVAAAEAAFDNELLSISEQVFTMPSAPADVY